MTFTLRFEACDYKCEIRNIAPDEFSYIVFIKEVKHCIAHKNEEVELYPNKKIKVKARRPNEWVNM